MDSANGLSFEYVNFDEAIEFEQNLADTFGMSEKFGKFQLGIVADKGTFDKVMDLTYEY